MIHGEEVMVRTDSFTAAKHRNPDDKFLIKEPFTKLYFIFKDKTMESLGFPDIVKETPDESVKLSGT